jgi:hypothetical protein
VTLGGAGGKRLVGALGRFGEDPWGAMTEAQRQVKDRIKLQGDEGLRPSGSAKSALQDPPTPSMVLSEPPLGPKDRSVAEARMKVAWHELLHQAIEGLGADSAGYDAKAREVILVNPLKQDPKLWRRMTQSLAPRYLGKPDGELAEEILTHIGSGEWHLLGVSELEAMGTLKRILAPGFQRFGDDFKTVFANAHPRVQRMVQGYPDMGRGQPARWHEP